MPVNVPPTLPGATATATVWLLLRAFASGCTAMTGVEAVSNGVSAFREPAVKQARTTLTVIVRILGPRRRGHRRHQCALVLVHLTLLIVATIQRRPDEQHLATEPIRTGDRRVGT